MLFGMQDDIITGKELCFDANLSFKGTKMAQF